MRISDRKPVLFEKSVHSIWTDPHVQQQLLKKHLDLLSDGASRRQESIRKTVDFILRHAKPESRLLDLGCGPGLYTSLFADAGFAVTGIDINGASIAYAVEQRKEIRYIQADYTVDYPTGQYNVVTMIYCDLGTHSDNVRDRLLGNIYRSLVEGGIFVVDVFSEGIINDRQENRNWEYEPSGGFWNEGEYLLLSQTFHYPQNSVFAYQYNLMLETEVRQFILWERYYPQKEITDILKKTGFRKIYVYKDLLGTNNFTSSSEMFIVAEK